jgi:prepilin-type N-terminal cleavage/methylation domain-containing protein
VLKTSIKKGFTLIELAVVIAIVAILAAVAIPRLTDMTASAEKATIVDFKSQLISALSMYTADNGAPPTAFTDFVSDTVAGATGLRKLATDPLGTGATRCTVAAATITCNAAFKKYSAVTYTFNNGGITGSATPTGGVAFNF